MSITVNKYVNVEITTEDLLESPTALAKAFFHMDESNQAIFFNELARLNDKGQMDLQFAYLTSSPVLRNSGRNMMCTIGDYGYEQEYHAIKTYDIGQNFDGYPIDQVRDILLEDILNTLPPAEREVKNLRYKVTLLQEKVNHE